MHVYEVQVPAAGDSWVDQRVDVEELGTFVVISVRDEYENRSFIVYADLGGATSYLLKRVGYSRERRVVLEDPEYQVAFDVSFQ